MPLQITYSTQSSEVIRLHHGTDIASATLIAASGCNANLARQYGDDGDFWTTTNYSSAAVFAQVNPACGEPAILSFDLPAMLVAEYLWAQPPAAYLEFMESVETIEVGSAFDGTIRFAPQAFGTLNEKMGNFEISPVF